MNDVMTRFISGYLNVPAVAINMTTNFFVEFENIHCFSLALQQEFTAKAMELFCQTIKKPRFYELRSILNICAVLFFFDEQVFLIGPYVEKEWQEQAAAEILAQQGLSSTHLIPYQFYYCNYPLAKSATVLQVCTAALQAVSPGLEPYEHRMISAFKVDVPEMNVEPELFDYNDIVLRYQTENEFLSMVKQGLTNEALEAFSRLSEYQLPKTHSYQNIYSMLNGFASLRTLLRKAAQEAGVHPAIIDSIAYMYAQKSQSIKTPSQVKHLSHDIIFSYTRAVQEVLNEKFTLVIRKAMNYIKLHLSTSLTLAEIANAANVTAGYLSHAFKAETGITVMKYVAKKRCAIAAELITTTTLPIAEISHHVGYPDNNYFVKVFKTEYKLTPSEYRQKFS